MAVNTAPGTSIGHQPLSSFNDDYSAIAAIITQKLSRVQTGFIAQVRSVTSSGSISAPGYVDVQPMVHQVDGAGNVTPHGIVSNIPFFRLAAGGDAVVMDPMPGDIGWVGCSNRDISAVKNSKAPARPGSPRRFRMADGLYFGSFLGSAPEQYIAFIASGIQMVSPTEINLSAPSIKMDSPDIAFTGGSLTHNGVNIGSTHEHTSAAPGSPTSPPI